MAIDYITIDTTSTLEAPTTLWAAVRSLRDARTKLERCRDWAVHNNDGSNYAQVETLFNLSAGKGADVVLLLDGSLQNMDGTLSGYINDLVSKVGPR